MIAGIDQQNSGEIWWMKLICDTHTSVPPEVRSIGLMFRISPFPTFVCRGKRGLVALVDQGAETWLVAGKSWSGACDRRISHTLSGVNNSAWHLPVHWHRDQHYVDG